MTRPARNAARMQFAAEIPPDSTQTIGKGNRLDTAIRTPAAVISYAFMPSIKLSRTAPDVPVLVLEWSGIWAFPQQIDRYVWFT